MDPGTTGALINGASNVLGKALSPTSAPSFATSSSVLHNIFDSSGWIVGTGSANNSGAKSSGGNPSTGSTPIMQTGEQPASILSGGSMLPLLLTIGAAWLAAKAL